MSDIDRYEAERIATDAAERARSEAERNARWEAERMVDDLRADVRTLRGELTALRAEMWDSLADLKALAARQTS